MRAIYETNACLELVITLEDDIALTKSGRVYLDEFCQDKLIDVIKCQNINDKHVVDALKKADLDWVFIIGWSQLANENVLASANNGVLGMHPTLLPIGRGRAAIPWAILKKLSKTGVTLFKIDEGVDTGLIGKQIEIPITSDETAGSLYHKVNKAHYELMKMTIRSLATGSMVFVKQDASKATEWPARKPEDGQINLQGSVKDAELLVRAVTRPYPGAFMIDENIKTTIWQAKIVDDEFTGKFLSFVDGKLGLIEYENEVLK